MATVGIPVSPPSHYSLFRIFPIYSYSYFLSQIQISYQSSISPVHTNSSQCLHQFLKIHSVECLFIIYETYINILYTSCPISQLHSVSTLGDPIASINQSMNK